VFDLPVFVVRSPALRLSFPPMKLFRIFKKQPRQDGDVPTARSTPSTSHPVDSEILAQGVDPITAE